MTAVAVAEEINADPAMLYRLMRALGSIGLLIENGEFASLKEHWDIFAEVLTTISLTIFLPRSGWRVCSSFISSSAGM